MLSGRPPRLWALGIAAILLLLTLLAPKLLAPLNHAWLALGDRLHRIVSPIVLGVVFFGLVTPIAWLRALLGKDDLALKRRPASATYWVDVERGRSRKGGFLDPF